MQAEAKRPYGFAGAPGSADSNRAKLERLLIACDGLAEIVEGFWGRRWSSSGTRLADTDEWREFYDAHREVYDAAHRPNATR